MNQLRSISRLNETKEILDKTVWDSVTGALSIKNLKKLLKEKWNKNNFVKRWHRKTTEQ